MNQRAVLHIQKLNPNDCSFDIAGWPIVYLKSFLRKNLIVTLLFQINPFIESILHKFKSLTIYLDKFGGLKISNFYLKGKDGNCERLCRENIYLPH